MEVNTLQRSCSTWFAVEKIFEILCNHVAKVVEFLRVRDEEENVSWFFCLVYHDNGTPGRFQVIWFGSARI
jgi:hypothetical protein